VISRERAAQIAERRAEYDWLRDQHVDPVEAAHRLGMSLFVARHEEQRRRAAGLPAKPVTTPHRIITCPSCRRRKPHQCKGWCNACYRRWLRAGRPEAGPPAPMPRGLVSTLCRAFDRVVREGRWAA
jgi:hypothetical protein